MEKDMDCKLNEGVVYKNNLDSLGEEADNQRKEEVSQGVLSKMDSEATVTFTDETPKGHYKYMDNAKDIPDVNSNLEREIKFVTNDGQDKCITDTKENADTCKIDSVSKDSKSNTSNVESEENEDDSDDDSNECAMFNLFDESSHESIEDVKLANGVTNDIETGADLSPGSKSPEYLPLSESDTKTDSDIDNDAELDNDDVDDDGDNDDGGGDDDTEDDDDEVVDDGRSTMDKSQSAVDMECALGRYLEDHKSGEGPPEDTNLFIVEKVKEPESGQEKTVEEEEDDFCCICLDKHDDPKILHKCSHMFCTECIDAQFRIKPVCPVCFVAYGVITGNQPQGHMSDYISKKTHLPGYEKYDTIVIHYSFGDGVQTKEHPHPGQLYYGTSRTAYLPNCPEGQKVLRLLKASFHRRLTFTVGRSRTTGCDNVVTWNDVHHKTSTCGGMESFGYPDPTYLQRVQEELACRGVTEESLKEFPVPK